MRERYLEVKQWYPDQDFNIRIKEWITTHPASKVFKDLKTAFKGRPDEPQESVALPKPKFKRDEGQRKSKETPKGSVTPTEESGADSESSGHRKRDAPQYPDFLEEDADFSSR